jgi:hypothetical protein
MGNARATGNEGEQPLVAALRKKIRRETVSFSERQLLSRASSAPESGAPISQEQLTALLEARERDE